MNYGDFCPTMNVTFVAVCLAGFATIPCSVSSCTLSRREALLCPPGRRACWGSPEALCPFLPPVGDSRDTFGQRPFMKKNFFLFLTNQGSTSQSPSFFQERPGSTRTRSFDQTYYAPSYHLIQFTVTSASGRVGTAMTHIFQVGKTKAQRG